MPPRFQARSEEELLAEVEPVIQSAVRHKLRVSLRASDYREHNLDALDLLGEIRLRLVKKLRAMAQDQSSPEINEFPAYAATIAYHCCADYWRAKYPERTSLKNYLRRLLDRTDGYATWPSEGGELLCGYVGWQFTATRAPAGDLQALRYDAGCLPRHVLPRSSYEKMSAEEWKRLLSGILDHLGAPLELDDLIAIVSPLVGVEDVPESSPEANPDGTITRPEITASSSPSPYSERLTCERLKLFWAAFLQLLPWHRAAYLLNIRDWDPMCLPAYGIATVEEIGRSLELKSSQLQILAQELGVPPLATTAGAGGGAKFAGFWNRLPLDDNLIAKLLGVSRAQVIGYRNKAKERLARSLRVLL